MTRLRLAQFLLPVFAVLTVISMAYLAKKHQLRHQCPCDMVKNHECLPPKMIKR